MTFPSGFTNAVANATIISAAHLNNLEAKVGIDSSAVVTSLDYLLKNAASINPGHKHSKLWASDGSPEAVDVLADGTVDIFKTTTSVVDAREDTLAAQLTLTPSGALGASAFRAAVSGYVTIPASNTQNMTGTGSNGAVEAVRGLVENNSASGTVADIVGTYGGVWVSSAANTTTKMSGLYGSVYADLGGTIGTMAACTLWAGVEPGAVTAVTNLMGLWIEEINSVAGVVNRYGIYIPVFGGVAPTTNDYAIYSLATQPSYLAGGLTIGDATVLGDASLVITSRRAYGAGSWLGCAQIFVYGKADEYPGLNLYCYGGTTDYEATVVSNRRARGTKASPTAALSGDFISYYTGSGFNNTLAGYADVAAIIMSQYAAATATGNPGAIKFLVSSGGAATVDHVPLSLIPGPNVILGDITALGTNAAYVLAIRSGTAPSTAPANMGQIWVEDINGAAGYAGLHKITETTATKEIIPGVVIKTGAGQTANPYEGLMEINTNENKILMYGDAGWRQLVAW